MDAHIEQLLQWIDQESAAQAMQLEERRLKGKTGGAERTGETLLDMAVADTRPGLAGATIGTFVKRNREIGLPPNRFRVGTPVMATGNSAETEIARGVVTARNSRSLMLSLPFIPEGSRFRLDIQPDEITRQRQTELLSRLQDASGRMSQLRDVLLGNRRPEFLQVPYENTMLNSSQLTAVRQCLSAKDISIIHGPPGTGKTTTVVEVIKAAVQQGQKILATAPSNNAVDNLLEKLVAAGVQTVRLGHPARVDRQLVQYTLDARVSRDDTMEIVKDMRRESEQYFRKAGRYTRSQPPRGAKQDMYKEGKRLRQDARLLEKTVVQWVLDRADVICSTNSINTVVLAEQRFDVAVIDEACQCTEPSCWVPLQLADKLVLAGDHCQLPPTVVSNKAAREGFAVSLLERLVACYGAEITTTLDTQYRMNAQIMQFSSDHFYEGTLQADESVAEHLLQDLETVESTSLTQTPVQFIDTAGADWEEEKEKGSESRLNPSEAELVIKKVIALVESNVPAKSIAVITPYAAQARYIRSLCEIEGVEIDTVDGFQGREKEVVIISCVRCNRDGEIGFLGDTRRMNVALTRARRKLIMIADSATLGSNEFYSRLLSYFDQIGAYSSVWAEM
ncbi:MAG: IGHMBP2 family helicase [Planctomycetaceae bacterium]|nr:IGHMBP2 family helicase [Planctomycetaceae bacterium]